MVIDVRTFGSKINRSIYHEKQTWPPDGSCCWGSKELELASTMVGAPPGRCSMCICKSTDDTNDDVGRDEKSCWNGWWMPTQVLFHSQDYPKTHFKEDKVLQRPGKMEVAMVMVENIRKMWYWWLKRVNCFLSKFFDFFHFSWLLYLG